MRRAVVATEEILEKNSAIIVDANNGIKLSVNGWIFTTFHDKICNSSDLVQLARRLEKIVNRDHSSTNSVSQPQDNDYKNEGDDDDDDDDDNVNVHDVSLRLPPMLFLKDILTIQHHHSNITISIQADDALVPWVDKHMPHHTQKRPLDLIKVSYSKQWSQYSYLPPDINNPISTPTSTQDSTIITTTNNNYNDNITPHNSSTSSSKDTNNNHNNHSSSNSGKHHTKNPNWDWTFMSQYCCTIIQEDIQFKPTPIINNITNILMTNYDDNNNSSSSSTPTTHNNDISNKYHTILSSINMTDHTYNDPISRLQYTTISTLSTSSNCPKNWTWKCQEIKTSGLNMTLLKSSGPDYPILFYDEWTFYQDDLEDCGESSYTAKLRVMPQCWFLMTRMFVRVDDAVIKIQETRFYHEFVTPVTNHDDINGDTSSSVNQEKEIHIYVDITWKECILPLDSALTSVLCPGTSTPFTAGMTSPKSGMPVYNNTSSTMRAYGNNNYNNYLSMNNSQMNSMNHKSNMMSMSILRDVQKLSETLPIVNEKYNIPRHFVLTYTCI